MEKYESQTADVNFLLVNIFQFGKFVHGQRDDPFLDLGRNTVLQVFGCGGENSVCANSQPVTQSSRKRYKLSRL
jgi:hypothetical protein